MLKITLEIMDKQKDIQNMLDRALINRMNKIVPKIASESREAIVKVVEETIKNTKEVQSLKKADIRGELGLKAAWVSRAINDIAASVSQTTSFRYKQFKKTGSKINGGISRFKKCYLSSFWTTYLYVFNIQNLRYFGLA